MKDSAALGPGGPDQPDRIVILNDSAAARGGATSLARRLALSLVAGGHAVTFFCGELGQDDTAGGGTLASHGIEVVSLGQARLLERGALTAARAGLWNGAAAAGLRAWIARHDSPRTVYHLHGWAQILSPAIVAALAPVAPRTVLHAHDFFLACPNGAYLDHPRGTVCTRAPLSAACLSTRCDKRSSAQKAWRILRHSVLRRHLLGPRWGAIAMIHPAMAEPLTRAGIDPARLHLALNPAEPFTPTRIAAEKNRRIAFVGRLAPEKGAADLAAAAVALGLGVTFVGEGPDEARIRAHLPDAVITGWQDRSGIGRHLRDARALAMPSRVPEPFGLAAAEASLSGLPVILPDISLIAAGVTAAGLGLSYAPGEEGLRRALARIVEMPEHEVRAMSLRGAAAEPGLAQPPGAWVAGILALYRATLQTAEAA